MTEEDFNNLNLNDGDTINIVMKDLKESTRLLYSRNIYQGALINGIFSLPPTVLVNDNQPNGTMTNINLEDIREIKRTNT